MAAGLGVGLIFLFRRQWEAWIVTTAVSSLALLLSALTLAAKNVEMMTSTKPLVRELMKIRRENEPVLASSFLVRGVFYYTRGLISEPINVIAGKPQPFWAEHPLRVIVWKRKPLEEFLRDHKTALCAVRKSDWMMLQKLDEFRAADAFQQIGENVIVRAHAVP
jgi:hypothetical protein